MTNLTDVLSNMDNYGQQVRTENNKTERNTWWTKDQLPVAINFKNPIKTQKTTYITVSLSILKQNIQIMPTPNVHVLKHRNHQCYNKIMASTLKLSACYATETTTLNNEGGGHISLRL